VGVYLFWRRRQRRAAGVTHPDRPDTLAKSPSEGGRATTV